MKLTRLSLFYLMGYLVPSSLMLLFAPQLALTLLQSNGNYGDVMPRMAGAALLALGLVVVQIVRHNVEALYLTVLGVRVVLVGILFWLFARSSDPFFVVVAGVVLVGMALTGSGYLLDARKGRAVAS